MCIDVSIDFATHTDGYWDAFWHSDRTLSRGIPDIDCECRLLRLYHKMLWSRRLPNGCYLSLDLAGKFSDYLVGNNGMRFGSDLIVATFRYVKNQKIIHDVKLSLENYDMWLYDYIKHISTIGGFMIFPKHRNSLNQCRGTNPFIRDRFDLTLECVRLYYDGVVDSSKNPLGKCLIQDKDFWDLFVNFRGFIDYFLLNDCVDGDYNVKFWIPNKESFEFNPLPKSVDEYFLWVENSLNFVSERNMRIQHLIGDD